LKHKTAIAIQEHMRAGSAKYLEKNKIKMDQKLLKMAEKNPLDFIETILAHNTKQI